MKKLILTAAVALAMASAYADELKIDWKTWMFDHTATDLTDMSGDIGILNNYDVCWQLIHTDDAVADAPVLENANWLADGEELIEARYLTSATSSPWDQALFYDNDVYSIATLDKATTTTFYVYQRVYELNPGQTVPVAGTWYYDSGVKNLRTEPEWNVEGMPFHIFAMGNAAQDYGVKPTQQVQGSTPAVPEPATMSLLGLGALALALRRKLRK